MDDLGVFVEHVPLNLTVGTYEELRAAAAVAESGDTIWMLDGPYQIHGTVWIAAGVTVRDEHYRPRFIWTHGSVEHHWWEF